MGSVERKQAHLDTVSFVQRHSQYWAGLGLKYVVWLHAAAGMELKKSTRGAEAARAQADDSDELRL